MGNQKGKINEDAAFSNILPFQKKEVLSSFSKNELCLINLLYQNLKMRSIEEGIDKQAFLHFCQIPGMWGQRLWGKFQKIQGRDFIEFDEFIYSIYQTCRAPAEEQDKFIFDLFNLGQQPGLSAKLKEEISSEEVICMIYNLPGNAVISSKFDNEYSIEKSPDRKRSEKLIIADKKYFHMLPDQIRGIVYKMMHHVSDNDVMNFEQFRKFLDLNPSLRSIIRDSLKPQLWTIAEKGTYFSNSQTTVLQSQPVRLNDGFNHSQLSNGSTDLVLNHQTIVLQPNKQAKHQRGGSYSCFVPKQAKQEEAFEYHPNDKYEGELLKIGKKSDMFIKRYYVLKNNALICYKDDRTKTPSDVIYLKGLYIEPHYTKGVKGFRIYHDCEYFKEKIFYHRDNYTIDKWIYAVKNEAQFFDVTKKYERLNMLGKGKFSTVYLSRSLENDELVAMKLIDKKQLTTKEREFLREEIQIIRSISHPNVVEMKDVFETVSNMYIMMECIQGGELFDHIKENEIGEKEASLITYQILEALQYLHLCGIVHRDLKPENILVECEEQSTQVHQIKLTDFGLSKIIVPGEQMFESCGTPAYVAPEVLHKRGYGKEVDIWSTGVILYTMLSRTLPFHSGDRKKTFKLIKESEPSFNAEIWKKVSPECINIIKKMLTKEPKLRITVNQALQDPWFLQYIDYIQEINRTYHPIIDLQTGMIVKPPRKSSLVLDGGQNQLSKLVSMQESMTDYAQMIGDDVESRLMIPQSKEQKKSYFDSIKQHQLEQIGSGDSAEEEIEKDVRKLQGVRQDRIGEIRATFKTPRLSQEYQEVIRTIQPVRGLNMQHLIQQEQQMEEHEQRKGQVPTILKTQRYFSDLREDDNSNNLIV